VALLRENLRRTVESVDELSSIAGAPVLGEFYRDRAAEEIHSPTDLVTSGVFRSLSESARILRTNLKLESDRLHTIAVTSPEGHHGKSTIAFSLASMLARSGVPTLLIDADVEEHRLTTMFGIEGRAGLTDILGGARITEVVAGTDLNKLHILGAGRPTAAASDLLERAFPALPSVVSEYYRAVVVDCPSLLPSNDARVIAASSSHTLLVVRDGGVTRRTMRAATSRLSILSIPLTAVVLNHARRRQIND
jgi:succinoglycan biosynthesis transport protein ExoP